MKTIQSWIAPFLLTAFYSGNPDLIVCKTGVFPDWKYTATLDLANNHMEYISETHHLTVRGAAVHSSVEQGDYYHLTFGFEGLAVELLNDGVGWWLCVEPKYCLRCGQFLSL